MDSTMNCPICDQDLTILDLVSATEHVNTCVEHGPSVLELDDTGQVVVKKNLPAGKQRKICPICDKTFQNLTTHFKICAIRHDVPPDLMMQHWENINSECKKPKKFPRDLLTSFINKCVKEGRIGEQVDYARALVLSLYDGDPEASNDPSDIPDTSQASTSGGSAVINSTATSSSTGSRQTVRRDVTQELLRNAANLVNNERPANGAARQASRRQKFRLEFVDDQMKRSNIALRIDRELAASRSNRYNEMFCENRAAGCDETDDDDCVIEIQEDDDCMIVQDIPSTSFNTSSSLVGICNRDDKDKAIDLNKLFFLARLKDCTDSDSCQRADCGEHELHLLLDDFKSYSGKSMDSDPIAQHDCNMQQNQQQEPQEETTSEG